MRVRQSLYFGISYSGRKKVVFSKELLKDQSPEFIWTVDRSGHVSEDMTLQKVCGVMHFRMPEARSPEVNLNQLNQKDTRH
jgi:hypothetical protein